MPIFSEEDQISSSNGIYPSLGGGLRPVNSDEEACSVANGEVVLSLRGPTMPMLDGTPDLAVALNQRLWPPDKRYLKVRFVNGEPPQWRYVENIVTEHYHVIRMHLRFEFLKETTTVPSDIRIRFTDYSASYVGRVAEKHPGEPTMWLDVRSSILSDKLAREKMQADILHEFGHALGMEHEHRHPYCEIDWNYRNLQGRNGWSLERVHANYKKIKSRDLSLTSYDTKSIMHYPIHRGDTKEKDKRLSLNSVLSEGDRSFLESMYPAKSSGDNQTTASHV